jgi:uncharacterized protein YidB (DUF937 family)
MGLLDQIAGAIGGASDGGGNPLMQLAMQYIRNQPGGLQGLIEQFTKSGLGEQAASWVSQGANLPVSGEQLAQALGSNGGLAQMLQQFGLNPSEGMDGLAKMLPDVVNQLTPNGRIEEEGGGLEQQLSSLLGKFGQ